MFVFVCILSFFGDPYILFLLGVDMLEMSVATTNLEYYCCTTAISRCIFTCTCTCTNIKFCVVYVHFQERESQKLKWLQRCVEELGNEKWVIPALKQMREICLLYLEVCIYVHSTVGWVWKCMWCIPSHVR